jgi:hypothetical protein
MGGRRSLVVVLRALAKGCSAFGCARKDGALADRTGLFSRLEQEGRGLGVPLREARIQGVNGALGERSPEVHALAKGCS